MQNIHSFINNISVPKTPKQLLYQMYERETFTIEFLFEDGEDYKFGSWTVPSWAKIGDISFFMHAKTAGTALKSLRKQFINEKDLYSPEEYNDALNFIEHGLELHKIYGGKIFAVAEVTGAPEYYDEPDDDQYWTSRIYAEIGNIVLLEHPVDISEFRDFITVSRQGTITPVIGEAFNKLRELIISHGNNALRYLTEANAAPFPTSAINSDNWLKLCYEWRNRFLLESEFRELYVNHFLRALSDNKRLFRECRVKKFNVSGYVDNIIMFNGKYLPVEIKINIDTKVFRKHV